MAFRPCQRHYRQISPKKSKFFRRHGLPPKPGARTDRDCGRPFSRSTRHSVHQSRAAVARPRRGRNDHAGEHSCPSGLQRAVLLQHPPVGRAVRHRAADPVALVSRQRDDRLVYLRSGTDRLAQADSAVCDAVFDRHRRAVTLALALGRRPASAVRAAARIARRSSAAGARPVQGIPPGAARRVHRKHQHPQQHDS